MLKIRLDFQFPLPFFLDRTMLLLGSQSLTHTFNVGSRWQTLGAESEEAKGRLGNSVSLINRSATDDSAKNGDLGELRRWNLGEVVGEDNEVRVFA